MVHQINVLYKFYIESNVVGAIKAGSHVVGTPISNGQFLSL
jgi:hypothetical protein